MPLRRPSGFLGLLWILDFALLAMLIAPMKSGSAIIIALGLWAVPTALLVLVTRRWWHQRRWTQSSRP